MSELKVERKENMCGGEGHILIKPVSYTHLTLPTSAYV